MSDIFSAKAYAKLEESSYSLEDVIQNVARHQTGATIYDVPALRAKIVAGETFLLAEQSTQTYRLAGQGIKSVYDAVRTQIHANMLAPILKEQINPPKKPRLILLAGRSGSGKTTFLKPQFPDAVYVDTDQFVTQFPGYNGLNAWTFHEESVDVAEKALNLCQALGLSALVETTLGSKERTLNRIRRFRSAGYKVELHYVYVSPFESACRAFRRFLKAGENGRYLPISRLLTQTGQEAHFDVLKNLVDIWGFYDGTSGGPTEKAFCIQGENLGPKTDEIIACGVLPVLASSTGQINPEQTLG